MAKPKISKPVKSNTPKINKAAKATNAAVQKKMAGVRGAGQC